MTNSIVIKNLVINKVVINKFITNNYFINPFLKIKNNDKEDRKYYNEYA